VTVAFCLGWGIFEFGTASPFWGVVFTGVGCVVAWQFFFTSYSDD
jgi:hypothetical protein